MTEPGQPYEPIGSAYEEMITLSECPGCGGHGVLFVTDGEPDVTCPACDGTGAR